MPYFSLFSYIVILCFPLFFFFFFFNDTATTEIYTLSLHDALPISRVMARGVTLIDSAEETARVVQGEIERRSEEHTSELQSPCNLVCRLLLEKKKKKTKDERHSRARAQSASDERNIYAPP